MLIKSVYLYWILQQAWWGWGVTDSQIFYLSLPLPMKWLKQEHGDRIKIYISIYIRTGIRKRIKSRLKIKQSFCISETPKHCGLLFFGNCNQFTYLYTIFIVVQNQEKNLKYFWGILWRPDQEIFQQIFFSTKSKYTKLRDYLNARSFLF